MQIVYYSMSGKVKQFVKNLGWPAIEITPANPYIEVNEPYILIVPTYERWMLEPVDDFLEYKENQSYLQGVAGSGNLNFGDDLFVYAAKDIAKENNVPMIFAFEYSGTPQDIENFKREVGKLEES